MATCNVCNEQIDEATGLEGIIDHIRVIHPDEYGLPIVEDATLEPDDFRETS